MILFETCGIGSSASFSIDSIIRETVPVSAFSPGNLLDFGAGLLETIAGGGLAAVFAVLVQRILQGLQFPREVFD